MMKIKKTIALIAAFASLTSTVFAGAESVQTGTKTEIPEVIEAAAGEKHEPAQPEETAEPENVINLYVNPKNAGEENTYRNINQAIEAVKGLDRTKNQVIVNIEGGTYDITTPIVFDKGSAGSSEYPVIYRRKNGSGRKSRDTHKERNGNKAYEKQDSRYAA